MVQSISQIFLGIALICILVNQIQVTKRMAELERLMMLDEDHGDRLFNVTLDYIVDRMNRTDKRLLRMQKNYNENILSADEKIMLKDYINQMSEQIQEMTEYRNYIKELQENQKK